MTIDELIVKLEELINCDDPEAAHMEADELLLEYINDKKVTEAFNSIRKWYA